MKFQIAWYIHLYVDFDLVYKCVKF